MSIIKRSYFALVLLGASGLLSAQAWSGYGNNGQHTANSSVAGQALVKKNWTAPVDQVLAGTTSQELLIHYGSPAITTANTILIPQRVDTNNTFQVVALNAADGTSKYTLTTDYTLPSHNWIPSFGPVLSVRNRYFWAGAGGTVYYRDSPDANSGATGQLAFYGLTNYQANPSAYNSTVQISTPLVGDRFGDIFFGFTVTGSNPSALVSGLARISTAGVGSWVSATALAGNDPAIVGIPVNCTPALSVDGLTVYVAVTSSYFGNGYLASANATTLAPIAHQFLNDPATGQPAGIWGDSSASPTVGPDGDVYYGVLESSIGSHHARGWLLHFDKNLSAAKPPGAFGWDATASVVPAAAVPSYHGPSSYLLLTKYNDYADAGANGTGQNEVAVLDPKTTEPDPVDGATLVMKEILTLLGPTANTTLPGVKEWCINSAVIDIPNKSAIVNSEDGNVYRWSFVSNAITQTLNLTVGIGEAYTPTLIGPDGTVYAINDAYLFAITSH